MSEMQKFAKACQEEIFKNSDWLVGFHVDWVDSTGQAKFTLNGLKNSAVVEWDGHCFRLHVYGPDVVYYESSRSIITSEQAILRVSAMFAD